MKFILIILAQFSFLGSIYAQNNVVLYKKVFRYIQKDYKLSSKALPLKKLGLDVDNQPIPTPFFKDFYSDLAENQDYSKLDSLFSGYYGNRYKDLSISTFLEKQKNIDAVLVISFSNVMKHFMYCRLSLKCLPNEEGCLIKTYLFQFENGEIKKVYEKID